VNCIDVGRCRSEIGLGVGRDDPSHTLAEFPRVRTGRAACLDRLVDDQPALRHALFAALATEIRRLTAQFGDLHFLDLPGRLARHLLRSLPAADPARSGDGPYGHEEERMSWPYTQGELAGMIGGSRQSVNRLLADFVGQGLLRFDGDDLVIPDPARLAAAAQR